MIGGWGAFLGGGVASVVSTGPATGLVQEQRVCITMQDVRITQHTAKGMRCRGESRSRTAHSKSQHVANVTRTMRIALSACVTLSSSLSSSLMLWMSAVDVADL